MGRMARYLLAAFRCLPDIEVRVLDPYGPGTFWKMPFYFLRCLVSLSVACARGRVDVTHINMSFGGSAVRKLVLMRGADKGSPSPVQSRFCGTPLRSASNDQAPGPAVSRNNRLIVIAKSVRASLTMNQKP